MTSITFAPSVTAIDRINVSIFQYEEKSVQPIDVFKRQLVGWIQKTNFYDFGSDTDQKNLRRLNALSDKWRDSLFLPFLNVLSVMLAFYINDNKMDKSEISVFYNSLPKNLKQHTTYAGLIRYSDFIKR